MKKADLDLFVCPYTHTRLRWANIVLHDHLKNEVQFATVQSVNRTFPVINGVLYCLEQDREELIEYVERKKFISAIVLAILHRKKIAHFFSFLPSWMNISIWTQISIFFMHGKWILFSLLRLLLTSSSYTYYTNRHTWKDALQFFVPFFIAKNRLDGKQLIWVDVGAGIHNYYKQVGSNVLFIVAEKEFINQFFSSYLYPSKNTVRVCVDAAYIAMVHRKVTIISCNDALQFISAQHIFLETVSRMVKNGGICWITSVPEKRYFKQSTLYPISRDHVTRILGRTCHFFSTTKLSEALFAGDRMPLKVAAITSSEKVFRYSCLVSNVTKKQLAQIEIPLSRAVKRSIQHAWDAAEEVA